MHDSFTPLGGLVPLFNIQTDEVIFGGVGAGLYSMLIYAVVAVFIGGLMVGRTPEYVGKKIEQKEVKMAIIAVLATSLCHSRLHRPQFRSAICEGRLLECARTRRREYEQWRRARLLRNPVRLFERRRQQRQRLRRNQRQHALVQPDASASTCWSEGSSSSSRLWQLPAVWLQKKLIPVTSGTLPTNGSLFVVLLIGTVIIVGALTYFPALSLGPIVEHFQMLNGKLF